jgi:hypothetical protein
MRQCVGLRFNGRNVSELRICRVNNFGKFVAVVNRIKCIFADFWNFQYFSNFPEIN